MKRHHEIEIKLVVKNPKSLRRQLVELGFHRSEPRHFENNILFDFADQRLRKARCLLRVRLVGRRALVTFKGEPLPSEDYKVRREIETEVKDGQQLREIFLKLGLQETFRYEKYRTLYTPGDRTRGAGARVLAFDETPIGNYLELEGSKQWIDRMAQQFGYNRGEYITASYGALYHLYCLERGLTPRNMVFSKRKS